MSKLDTALELAAKGFKVFPIAVGQKRPPLLNGWPARATSDPEEVRQFWLAIPDANIGIHCEGLVVIDVDVHKGGMESLETLDDLIGFPATYEVETPTGGRHIYYRLPEGHPGVPNSVESLGKGLDIRSTSGYVVAPGSTVEAGEYTECWDHEIAAAPEWLVQKLGTFTKRERTETVNIPDAGDELIDRAYEWLEKAERSVRGQGGDQAAYRVACGLRDMGVSYRQACELMRSEAWDDGCGWRLGWLEDKPIASAYKYATGEPGAKAASPEDFKILEDEDGEERNSDGGTGEAEGGRRTLVPQRIDDFTANNRSATGYLIKGVLQKASYAQLFGDAGAGKTFVALDIAYKVAAGAEWMGRRTKQGTVLYLAYEGIGGLENRCRALRQHYGDNPVPLFIHDASGINLRESKGRRQLAAAIKTMPTVPSLIIIDTFALALMGGDENSAQDTGAFNSAVGALIAKSGATVLIIHHSGKNKSAGARGSSAIRAAMDTELEVDRHEIIARKQREGDLGDSIKFSLTRLVLGVDEDGDDISSCVVMPRATDSKRAERLVGHAARGFALLCDMSPGNRPVLESKWRDKCEEFLPEKRTKTSYYDLRKILIDRGYIVIYDDGTIARRLE